MPSERDYLLVGVTGGIGSGKSVVCAAFERLGRVVISADAVAKEITDCDEAVKNRVRALLGAPSFTAKGILDRKFVASKVFADPALKKKLDAIVHPAVFREIDRLIAALPDEKRRPYVVVEAALIYESGMDKRLDYVIVVQASEETRIRRVIERDRSGREDVLRRIAAQMPADAKAEKADFVILNEKDSADLQSKVQFLDTLLRHLRPRQDSRS